MKIKWRAKNTTPSEQFKNPIENRRKKENRYHLHTNT